MPPDSGDLDLTISVCHPKHLSNWSVVQENLRKFVPAKTYLLVVPDESVDQFSEVTHSTVRIEPESIHAAAYADVLRDALKAKGQSHRYGWFLQQFIKIGALRGHDDTAKLLIWDADTVPLRPITFFEACGRSQRVGYFSERVGGHEPMFAQIEALMGLPKATKRGFISQCFPLWGKWANEFFQVIEDNGLSWHENIISSIPFERGSALSEYELLGTFIATKHEREVFWVDLPWIRNGHLLFKSARVAADVPESTHSLYYAAFETYDQLAPTSVSVTLVNDFESTVAQNGNTVRRLAQAVSDHEASQPRAEGTRMFVGLREDLNSLVSVGGLNSWRDASVINPRPNSGNLSHSNQFESIIPGRRSGYRQVFVFNAEGFGTALRKDLLESHSSNGLILAPSKSQLAVRFWAELVDWNQSDAQMRSVFEGHCVERVQVIPWSQLPIDSDTCIFIHMLGFESELLVTLIEAIEDHQCVRPEYLAFISVFEDNAVRLRLESLGYQLCPLKELPNSVTPVVWGFSREVEALPR